MTASLILVALMGMQPSWAASKTYEIQDPTIDLGWMDDDEDTGSASTFRYVGGDSGDGTAAFNISVEESTASTITFLMWWTQDGEDQAFDRETFDRETRESVDQPGYYATNFVNKGDIVNGYAYLGTRVHELTEVTTSSYVFSNGDASFHFDRDEGWLREFVGDSGRGSLSVSGVGTMQALPDNDLDPYGLQARFVAHALYDLDPHEMKDDLVDGHVALRLLGETYELELEPAPWNANLVPVRINDDGTETPTPSDFETVAYLGHVIGAVDSVALVVVTEEGVGGVIRVDDLEIEFEPVVFSAPAAPIGLTVAYRAHEAIMPDDETDHDYPVEGGDDVGVMDTTEDDVSTAGHEPGPDRDIVLWASSGMYHNHGTNKVNLAYNTLNLRFNHYLGYSFSAMNGVIYYCETTGCDAERGMDSNKAGTLLSNWGEWVRDDSRVSGFDLAHLFVDDLDAYGAAYQSGRYGVTDGSRSQNEMAYTFTHEVGHNFNGDHGKRDNAQENGCTTSPREGGTFGRATCWWHWHSAKWTHCHLPSQSVYELTRVCLDPHEHDDGEWHKHYSLMWQTRSDGMNSYVVSDDNYDWIRSCNFNSYSEGSHDTGADNGFGYWCTN